MTSSNLQLGKLTISLHWLVAIMMISLLSVGFYMETFAVYALYPIHKAVGVLALLIILPRVIWRLMKGWPTPVSDYKKSEQVLSKIIHWVLLVGTVLMPVSGMIYSGFGGYGIDIFGLELVPTNKNADGYVPFNGAVSDVGAWLHGTAAYLIAGSVLLHIGGAFKHHIIDKDLTLKRMLGKSA